MHVRVCCEQHKFCMNIPPTVHNETLLLLLKYFEALLKQLYINCI